MHVKHNRDADALLHFLSFERMISARKGEILLPTQMMFICDIGKPLTQKLRKCTRPET